MEEESMDVKKSLSLVDEFEKKVTELVLKNVYLIPPQCVSSTLISLGVKVIRMSATFEKDLQDEFIESIIRASDGDYQATVRELKAKGEL
jgi:hypothetical protein